MQRPRITKTHAKIHRRRLLRNAALATLEAPVVGATMARAAAPPTPRLLIDWWPNGLNIPDAGPGAGQRRSETGFSMGEYFRMLEPHDEDAMGIQRIDQFGHPAGGSGPRPQLLV